MLCFFSDSVIDYLTKTMVVYFVTAPYIPEELIPKSKPKTEKVDAHDSVQITFTDVFSNLNGPILSYSLIVVPNVADPSADVLQNIGTWSNQVDVEPQGLWIAIYKCSDFFTRGKA